MLMATETFEGIINVTFCSLWLFMSMNVLTASDRAVAAGDNVMRTGARHRATANHNH